MSRDGDSIVYQHARAQVTVGDLRDWHYIELICPSCRHIGWIYPRDLRGRWQDDVRIVSLERSFKCQRCGERGTRKWDVWKMGRNA